jgi:hypothetical protein
MQLDPTLIPTLDTAYRPIQGWTVQAAPAGGFSYSHHDPAPETVKLGKEFSYAYPTWTGIGLARTSGTAPKLRFEPADYRAQFGLFPELLYPTSLAESGANFLVINCWDAAAFTAGFAQLAAHTQDDLLPMFETLATRLPAEFATWFPELRMVSGRLAYVKGDRYKPVGDLVPPRDGAPFKNYYCGDFMGFFNPDRRRTDHAELHATARWVEWSRRSAAMRAVQVEASIANLADSVKVLHRALRQQAPAAFPNGVDGMRCDWLAGAVAVPHLSPGKVGLAVEALQKLDPLEALRTIEYGPGDREETVIAGVRARPILATLHFDLATMQPR